MPPPTSVCAPPPDFWIRPCALTLSVGLIYTVSISFYISLIFRPIYLSHTPRQHTPCTPMYTHAHMDIYAYTKAHVVSSLTHSLSQLIDSLFDSAHWLFVSAHWLTLCLSSLTHSLSQLIDSLFVSAHWLTLSQLIDSLSQLIDSLCLSSLTLCLSSLTLCLSSLTNSLSQLIDSLSQLSDELTCTYLTKPYRTCWYALGLGVQMDKSN